jgi:hypothetical protein
MWLPFIPFTNPGVNSKAVLALIFVLLPAVFGSVEMQAFLFPPDERENRNMFCYSKSKEKNALNKRRMHVTLF